MTTTNAFPAVHDAVRTFSAIPYHQIFGSSLPLEGVEHDVLAYALSKTNDNRLERTLVEIRRGFDKTFGSTFENEQKNNPTARLYEQARFDLTVRFAQQWRQNLGGKHTDSLRAMMIGTLAGSLPQTHDVSTPAGRREDMHRFIENAHQEKGRPVDQPILHHRGQVNEVDPGVAAVLKHIEKLWADNLINFRLRRALHPIAVALATEPPERFETACAQALAGLESADSIVLGRDGQVLSVAKKALLLSLEPLVPAEQLTAACKAFYPEAAPPRPAPTPQQQEASLTEMNYMLQSLLQSDQPAPTPPASGPETPQPRGRTLRGG